MNIVNNCKNGCCSCCGECCTDFLPVTKEEVIRIKEYLFQHPEIKEQDHISGNNLKVLCAFRDEENKKCLIYDVRPEICRKFCCNQNETIMTMNRNLAHKKAYFNHMDNWEGGIENIVSSHALFFNNFEWELKVLNDLCGGNEEFFKKVLKRTYCQYEVKEEK